MNILETNRLILCQLKPDDAAFILELLNTPGWLKFIGNKKVLSLEDAGNYILNIPIKSYEQFGFGLMMVKLKNENVPVGICGLIKRDSLEDFDIGFALLPQYEGKGYAFESAKAVLNYAKTDLGITRIVAITSKDNFNSIKLLQKIGLGFEKTVLSPGNEELMLFVTG